MAIRSRLARRLRRHGRMATLMRSAAGPAAPFHMPGGGTTPSTPTGEAAPARAIVLPPETDLPAGQVAPLVAEAPQAPKFTLPESPATLQRSPAARQPIAQAPPAAPQPQAAQPAVESEPAEGEADWDRLQRIVDLHRARQRAEENPPTDTVSRKPEEEVTHEVSAGGEAASGDGGLLGPLSEIEDVLSPGGGGGSSAGAGDGLTAGGGDTEVGPGGGGGGDTTAGGDFGASADLTVGGSLTAGGSARVGGDASVGAGLQAGTEVNAGGDVSAGGEISAGTEVTSGGEMSAGGNISPATNATATGDMSAGGDMTVGGAQLTLGNSTVSGNVTSGGVIGTTGSMSIQGNAQSGGTILSGDNLTIGNEGQIGAAAISKGDTNIGGGASVGGVLSSKGDVDIGGQAMAGGGIKAGGDVEVSGGAAASSLKSGGSVEVGGSLTVSGRANIGGSISAGGSVTIHGPTNISSASGGGGGAVQPKRDEGSSPAQVPLQDAWPVQRKAVPEPQVPDGEPEASEPADGPVSAALAGVSAGRDSDSSIEYIPPRRPRPGGAPAPQASLQRSPQPESSSIPISPDAEVDTEIGPLPSDLWSLIGQTPPAETKPVQGEPTSPEASPPVAPQLPAKKQVLPVPEKSPAADIQRSEATSAAPEGESKAQDEQTEPDVDVDALARKVYTELRHRLALEFERMRKFF